MTTITFKNGEQFTVKAVWSRTSSFQGADRKTLEIRFVNEENLFEKLKSVYSNAETLAEIYVKETNEEGEVLASSYHTDYTLGMELGLKSIEDEQQWIMKLAQKTVLEIMQEKQALDIEDTQVALMELAEMIAGGTE